jgi:hypothetical protein
MSYDRAMQIIQHGTFLQPQGLDHGQHPLHEPAPRRAVATEGVLPPQYAQPQDAFRMIVGGLDSLDRREQPQRRVESQDVGAKGRRLGIRAGATLVTAQSGDGIGFALPDDSTLALVQPRCKLIRHGF